MALHSVVAVADNTGLDTSGIQLAFLPGDPYPKQGTVQLTIQGQPFLPSRPTRVVPAIVAVSWTYGRYQTDVQPPTVEPDEHWLRELAFATWYVEGSWHVSGDQATVTVGASASLRDNTPGGQSEPDDAFVAALDIHALCIWTVDQPTIQEEISRVIATGRNILGR